MLGRHNIHNADCAIIRRKFDHRSDLLDGHHTAPSSRPIHHMGVNIHSYRSIFEKLAFLSMLIRLIAISLLLLLLSKLLKPVMPRFSQAILISLGITLVGSFLLFIYAFVT